MRTRLLMGVAVAALALAGSMPVLAAGSPGSIDIVSPDGGLVRGVVPVTWIFTTGSTVTAASSVRIEAKLGGPVWSEIATAPITDAAAVWDTSSWSDANGYSVRISIVGTNKQDMASEPVTIDNGAPVLDVAVDPAACAVGWCPAASATVTVTASDALSGLAVDPTGVQVVSAQGATDLSFLARDNAGNETTRSVTVSLDSGLPEITMAVDPAGCGAPTWCNGESATVAIDATDATSGLAVDPSGTQIVTAEGPSRVEARAVDLAGNETVAEQVVLLDRTAPITTFDETDAAMVRALGSGDLSGAATDLYSGVASTTVTFTDVLGNVTTGPAALAEDGTWSVSTEPFLPGPYTVTAASTDFAGNAGPAATLEILIV